MACLLHDDTTVCVLCVYTTVSDVCYTAVCLLCIFRTVCNPEVMLQFTFPLAWKTAVQVLRH